MPPARARQPTLEPRRQPPRAAHTGPSPEVSSARSALAVRWRTCQTTQFAPRKWSLWWSNGQNAGTRRPQVPVLSSRFSGASGIRTPDPLPARHVIPLHVQSVRLEDLSASWGHDIATLVERRQIGQIPQTRIVQKGACRYQQLVGIALDEAALEQREWACFASARSRHCGQRLTLGFPPRQCACSQEFGQRRPAPHGLKGLTSQDTTRADSRLISVDPQIWGSRHAPRRRHAGTLTGAVQERT
jgi:hypothetical protein